MSSKLMSKPHNRYYSHLHVACTDISQIAASEGVIAAIPKHGTRKFKNQIKYLDGEGLEDPDS